MVNPFSPRMYKHIVQAQTEAALQGPFFSGSNYGRKAWLLLIKMDICDRDERSMRMVCKTMLIKPEGTPLVTDHKSLPYGPQSCPLP
jgi:hypothetical protein